MNETVNCRSCGRAVPADMPGGTCPGCLLRLGLSDGEEPEAAAVPSVGDLQALFPQFEILECLGRGGMGAVYKARQPALNRLVALKVLRVKAGLHPEFIERFRREAQAMARLSHPNIVTIHDFGEAGGVPYLVMEMVEGTDLRKRMAAGRIAPHEAVNIALSLCDALDAAHAQGIVHRDIKPANILIDRSGRVKVADFGLAKLAGDSIEEAALTSSGHTMGTPFYMAPEQHIRTVETDSRADVYALGVILYEMLTGELPLGHFAPASEKVGTAAALDAVLLRAMESDPARRFARARDLKRALLEVVQSGPLVAGAKEQKVWRLTLAALSALALVALLAGLVLFVGARLRRLPVPRDVVAHEGRYYKVFVENVSWDEARNECARMGGRLAVVRSQADNDFLAGLSRSHVWLGATDAGRKGTWRWVDGTALSYSNWEAGEPNDADGWEDCLMMTKYGKWNDLANHAGIIDGYICEWDRTAHPGPVTGTDGPGIVAALRRENPEYDGSGIFKPDGGPITEAVLTGPGLRSIASLKGLALKRLDIRWSAITDLVPLVDMPLSHLDLTRSRVADLGPLAGLPLTDLRLEGTAVRDLAPLKGMSLKYLDIGHTPVTDLSPLGGMPLEELHMNSTRVRDLTPVAGMPLRRIGLLGTLVEDLSPLQTCTGLQRADAPACATNLQCLTTLPELRWMNGRPLAPGASGE
jgi:hypothetical protein